MQCFMHQKTLFVLSLLCFLNSDPDIHRTCVDLREPLQESAHLRRQGGGYVPRRSKYYMGTLWIWEHYG